MKTDEELFPTADDYQWALDAQSACNLSGIVHTLSRIVAKIWNEANATGKGTHYANTHPIVRLFAEQIYHLATKDGLSYPDAHHICTERSIDLTSKS
jgi:hypothetical protein